jgi:hypothetical protein
LAGVFWQCLTGWACVSETLFTLHATGKDFNFMENKELKTQYKSYYGKDYWILEDKHKRLAFKRLTGRKTITNSDIICLNEITNGDFNLIKINKNARN